MTTTLKILISAAGLAALATSPVLAASHVRHAAPASASSTTVVAPNGQVLGADPDAQVRHELQRDWGGANASGR